MSYYYQFEGPDNYAGNICAGGGFVTDSMHNRIMALDERVLDIANRYTINIEKSRKAGVEVCEPLIERCDVGCRLSYRGVGMTLNELKNSTFVTYWFNFYGDKNLSSAEMWGLRKEVTKLIDEILQEHPSNPSKKG